MNYPARADRWALGAVGLLFAVLAFRNITDLDIGTHIASGRFILEHGQVPRTDPFTWTIPNHPYLAYHWGFQVLAYGVDSAFGGAGLASARLLTLLLCGGFLASAARHRGVDPLWVALVGLVATISTEHRFAVRPELFSQVLLAATVWLLERRRAGRSIPVWGFALIQLIWINTHIYAFGWAVMLAYAGADLLRARRIDGWTARAYGFAIVALFVNPYLLAGIAYPFSMLFSRMYGGNLFKQAILELQSPFVIGEWFPGLRLQFLMFKVLFALGALACLGAIRQRRWDDLVLLVTFGSLSAVALRNIPLLAFGGMVASASGLDARFAFPKSRAASWLRTAAACGVALVATALSANVAFGSYYVDSGRFEAPRLEYCELELSIRGADFMERHQLDGRGFNTLNPGGVLAWRHPSGRIFVDGRNEVTGEEFFREVLRLSTPDGFAEGDERYDFPHAFLAHWRAPELATALFSNPRWRLVYVDGVSSVFVKRNGPFGDIPAALLPAPIVDADERRTRIERAAARSRAESGLMRWFWRREGPMGDALQVGSFLAMVGRFAEAERPLLEALETHADLPQVWKTLAVVYTNLGVQPAARLCMREAARLDPSDP